MENVGTPPPPPPPALPHVSPWTLVALWTVPAALSTFETVMFTRQSGHPAPVYRAFASEAPGWYTWALLTPLIIRLGQRFPLDRRPRPTALAVHIAASLAASTLVAIVSALAGSLVLQSSAGLPAMIRAWFLSGLAGTTIAYFAVLGVSYALLNTARLRARERHAEQLAAQLTEAQLGALKTQLQPHFLFNSLNAIMALVRDQDTSGAIRALGLLSDLLRTTLQSGPTHEIQLRAELAFIRQYLAMEQLRFGDRLHVDYAIADDLLEQLVPTFILQPLVENALRHGVTRTRQGGRIEIAASSTADRITLTVRDDGKGLPTGWQDGAADGVGIANTRSRLTRMYGPNAQLTIAPAPTSSGVVATITLPRH
jgi:two-component system, LytTR family, sensor kinase